MKKFFIIFCVIILLSFLLIGYLIIRDAISLNDLNKEVEVLNKLDFKKDNFNRPIKSRGGYVLVEKSIKKYLDSCSSDVKNIMSITDDKELINILSYDNYSNDGKEFKKSIDYINKSKTKYNKIVDELLLKLDKDYIYNYITDKTNEDHYIEVYRDIMINGNISIKLDNLKESIIKNKEYMNGIFDSSLDVLNYLKDHSDDWELEDGEIKFRTQDLYNNYEKLISKVKKKDE